MQFNIPSKTFLIGEYAVLDQAPGWVITTYPAFTLIAEKKIDSAPNVLKRKKNPSANLYRKYKNELKHYRIEFFDPYQGSGGLGASTAYFLGLFLLIKRIKGEPFDIFNPNDRLQLLNEYFACCDHQPSGVDLIAQACGGICYFDRNNNVLEKKQWPLIDLSFLICKTEEKIATHHHLKSLQKINSSSLQKIIAELNICSQTSLINSITSYAHELKNLKLVCSNTNHLLDTLSKNKDILAAKGCGALSADVILLVMLSSKKQAVQATIESLALRVIADEMQICS